MAIILVVTSKVKAHAKRKGEIRVSADAIEALSDSVGTLIDKAKTLAEADGRTTIKARDITEAREAEG